MAKRIVIYLTLLLVVLALFLNSFSSAANGQQSTTKEKGIYQVLADAKAGRVAQIRAMSGSSDVLVLYNDGDQIVRSRLESNDSVTTLLLQAGVPLDSLDVVVQPAPAWGGVLNLITILLPVLLMIGFFLVLLRQLQKRYKPQLSQQSSPQVSAGMPDSYAQTIAAKDQTIAAQLELIDRLRADIAILQQGNKA